MTDTWPRTNPDSLGTKLTDYTPADTDLTRNVKAVFFDADGTCTVKNAGGGSTFTVPVISGIPLPVVPGRITAMSGPTKCFLVT